MCVRGSWRLNKDCNILTPQPLRVSTCVVLVLLDCSTGGLGAQPLWDMFSSQHLLTNWSPNSIGGPEGPFCWVVAFPTTSCLQLIWIPTHWLPVLTDLYNSSIAHSISLEWHVWLSSSGNNCHAVHRLLSSSVSVYDCNAGFYLVPFCQPSPPTRFLSITAIGMCHFLPVHHFRNGMFGRVEGQHTTVGQTRFFSLGEATSLGEGKLWNETC